MSTIRIRGLSKHYAGTTAVDSLELTVRDGEFVSLLGPSGCGKTTTLRCIAGLEKPDRGEIRIGDQVMVDCGRDLFVAPHRRGLGMVFQSYALWPHMTVFGNVAYPLRARRLPRPEVGARVREALGLVGLAEYGPRPSSALSGGQQQRVALARALASGPRVLLLDEPLSNLDAGLRAQLRHEIRRIHRETGTTSVYVTHDQSEAITLSDRILVLHDGRIEQTGTPTEIFRAPANAWVARFVGFENFLVSTVTAVDGDLLTLVPRGWGAPLQAHAAPGAARAVGDTVELAVRASSLAPASGAGNRLTASVRDRTYLGEVVEYELAVPGGQLRARLPEREAMRIAAGIGETVALAVAPEDLVVLPTEPTATRPRSVVTHAAP